MSCQYDLLIDYDFFSSRFYLKKIYGHLILQTRLARRLFLLSLISITRDVPNYN